MSAWQNGRHESTLHRPHRQLDRAGRIDGDDIVILDAADVGDVLRADSEVAETGEAILERPPAWLRLSLRPTRWCAWA